jgi:hypothetical protein
MAHDFLIFDFETNEEAAQQARHKVEGWTQGFRLGKKMLLKFEREDAKENDAETASAAKAGGKKKAAAKDDSATEATKVRVLVRLDFSEHEKLSHQRWLDRIPNEEPFKSAKAEIIQQGDPEFAETAELFDSLT